MAKTGKTPFKSLPEQVRELTEQVNALALTVQGPDDGIINRLEFLEQAVMGD